MPAKDKTLSEDEVKRWLRQIDVSLSWRKPYEDTWTRIIDYLKGEYYDEMSDEDRVCVNMVHPHVRVVIPAIYSRNPDILVSPGVKESIVSDIDKKRADIMQRLLRYYLKELKIKQEVKLCLLDAVLCGHAWIKTGYSTNFDIEEQEPQTLVSKFLTAIGVKDEQEVPERFINENISSEELWAVRCSPFDMIVPFLSRRPEELDWIGERLFIPYDDVMDDPEYDTTDLKPTCNANQVLAGVRGVNNWKSIPDYDEVKYSILYEVYNKKTREVITFAKDHYKRPLRQVVGDFEHLDARFHGYVNLRFNEIIDEFYPQGDIEPAEPQILELNANRTIQNKHVKRYNRVYGALAGALGEDAKTILREKEDGAVFEFTNTHDRPISEQLQPIIDAALPPEVYASEKRITDTLINILGTLDYSSQGGARTATEASILATQSRFRVEERIDLVGMFVQQVIRNLMQHAQRYLNQDQISSVLGVDAIYWKQGYSPSQIRKEYACEVVYGSSAPINREVDKEQFTKFFLIARNDPYYNQVKIRLDLARKHIQDNPEGYLADQILAEVQQQWVAAIKSGALMQALTNSSGPQTSPGRVPDPSKLGTSSVDDSGESGEVLQTAPEVPGGTGGTALA